MDSQYPTTSLPPPAQYYATGSTATVTPPTHSIPDSMGSSYMHDPRQQQNRAPPAPPGYEEKETTSEQQQQNTQSSSSSTPQQQQQPIAGGLSGIEPYCGSIGYDEREKRFYILYIHFILYLFLKRRGKNV